MTAKLRVKVICKQCDGNGLIYGPVVRDEWGKSLGFREEQSCPACNEAGYTVERIELDESAIEALRDALLSLGSMA